MTIRVKAIVCQGIGGAEVLERLYQGNMPEPKVALAKGDHNHWR